MENISLRATELISPDAEDSHEDLEETISILSIYDRIFAQNAEDCLPKVLVLKADRLQPLKADHEFFDNRAIILLQERRFALQQALGAKFVLLDGHHRAIAATIRGKPIPVSVVSTTHDVKRCKRMAKTGELTNYPRGHADKDSIRQFIDELRERFRGIVNRIFTLQELTEIAVMNEEAMPDYMRRAFMANHRTSKHILQKRAETRKMADKILQGNMSFDDVRKQGRGMKNREIQIALAFQDDKALPHLSGELKNDENFRHALMLANLGNYLRIRGWATP